MEELFGHGDRGRQTFEATESQIEKEISQTAHPPKGVLGSQSIRGLVEAGEKTGNADVLSGDFIRHDLSQRRSTPRFVSKVRLCPQHAAR